MTRSSYLPFASFLLAAAAACLLFSGTAWAKYVPPPAPKAPKGHCVTTVGWLAPADIDKIDEAAEIAKLQTGYTIDILLAASEEPIDEIADETFKAWAPGDKGILLVLQPNFPKGQRKARLQVGRALDGRLTSSKAKTILRDQIGPLFNGTDQIRETVAGSVQVLAQAVGADLSPPVVDAGPVALAPPPVRDATPPPPKSEGIGGTLAIVFGGFIAIVLAYVAFERFRPKGKGSAP